MHDVYIEIRYRIKLSQRNQRKFDAIRKVEFARQTLSTSLDSKLIQINIFLGFNLAFVSYNKRCHDFPADFCRFDLL